MPFNAAGTYTPASGATSATPGQVLQSAVWDAIFTDISSALTTLMTQAINTPNWANVLAANGGLMVWQRGAGGSASFAVNASTTQYTADRWYIATGANQACTVAQVNGLDVGASPGHAAQITRNSGQTGTTILTFGYPLTGDEVSRLRGQKVSAQIIAKTGANWSPTSGTLNVDFYVGTGAAGKRGAGFTGETHVFNLTNNFAVSTTATLSGTSAGIVPANATQGEIQVTWTPTGTAGADDSVILDAAIMVPGSIIENYDDIPFEIMLAMCKRHYRKSFPYSVAPAQGTGPIGAAQLITAAAAASGFWIQHYPISLRATGTYTTYNPSGAAATAQDLTTAVSVAVSIDPSGGASQDSNLIYVSAASAAGHIIAVHWTADAGL